MLAAVPRPQRPITGRRGWLLGALALATGVPARAQIGAASGGLPALIARAKPSIVAIGTFRATDSPRFGFRGTGFAVGDGTVVATNVHVLPATEGADAPALMAQVPTAGGLQARPLQVLAIDREHDLVLLRLGGEALPALPLAESALAAEGTSVALIGFPIGGVFGFSPVTHRGIVSSVTRVALPAPTAQRLTARALAQLREGAFAVYQLDATAYPGNSGGPVFDVDSGQVLGVLNMVLVRSTRESALSNPTGISYAIPVRHLRELMAR